jgi:hypothetical protein
MNYNREFIYSGSFVIAAIVAGVVGAALGDWLGLIAFVALFAPLYPLARYVIKA